MRPASNPIGAPLAGTPVEHPLCVMCQPCDTELPGTDSNGLRNTSKCTEMLGFLRYSLGTSLDTWWRMKKPPISQGNQRLYWLRGLEATYTEHASITGEGDLD